MTRELLDLPTEMLTKIFVNLDDTSILTSRLVCVRFKEIGETSIIEKYNGTHKHQWYHIDALPPSGRLSLHNTLRQHRPFVLQRVRAIKITLYDDLIDPDHPVIQIINRLAGENLKMIKFNGFNHFRESYGVNLSLFATHLQNVLHLFLDTISLAGATWMCRLYPKLSVFKARYIQNCSNNHLKTFIRMNPQLQHIGLHSEEHLELNIFDGTKLDSLQLQSILSIPQPIITGMQYLNHLELEIERESVEQSLIIESFVKKCPMLKELRLLRSHKLAIDEPDTSITGQDIDVLCSLHQMNELEWWNAEYTAERIKKLFRSLSALTSINFHYGGDDLISFTLSILSAAANHRTLNEIEIRVRDGKRYDESSLDCLMQNVNERIKLTIEFDHEWNRATFIITSNEIKLSIWNGIMMIIKTATNSDSIQTPSNECLEYFVDVLVHNDVFNFDETYRNGIVQDYIRHTYLQKNGIRAEYNSNMETFFSYFGDHITRTFIREKTNRAKCLSLINANCKTNLKELYLNDEIDLVRLVNVTFPELTKLKLFGARVDFSWISSMICPKLANLIVEKETYSATEFDVIGVESLRSTNLFDNLTTIEIIQFSETATDILNNFNDVVCSNLRELSLVNVCGQRVDVTNDMINAIGRFSNLTSLRLILDGIDQANTKFLFEKCSKLKSISLDCTFMSADGSQIIENTYFFSMFKHLRQHCTSLETLQIVTVVSTLGLKQLQQIKDLFTNTKVEAIIYDHSGSVIACTSFSENEVPSTLRQIPEASSLQTCSRIFN